MTPPQDSAPARAEIVTRSRMAEAWEEGRKDFPSEIARDILPDPAEEVAWMCHYASMLLHGEALGRAGIRERLWKLANAAARILPKDYDVLALALDEYTSAAAKHPGMTLDCDGPTDDMRLFALVEEIGEVAACLTYDNEAETGHGSDLESEVIQVIALALAWATRYLEGEEV
jgi:hypothetical protein|nr:MAG TPA: hypothetical protein [Caudoviricetes sp.]